MVSISQVSDNILATLYLVFTYAAVNVKIHLY